VGLEVQALSNTELDMKVIFLIPEEEDREIPTDIPSVPTVESGVSFDGNTVYLVVTVVHTMIDGNYEATCSLKKLNNMNNRIYLAGPDVFFPDVIKRAEFLKAQCNICGFEGVFPLDSEVKLEEPINQEKNGYLIYEGNLSLIKSCVAVLANISPFRGPSIDAGTAFEIGYGLANGLIVVGYTINKTFYKERVKPDGLLIEDFEMIDNLMIHGATCGKIFESSLDALGYLSNTLYK